MTEAEKIEQAFIRQHIAAVKRIGVWLQNRHHKEDSKHG